MSLCFILGHRHSKNHGGEYGKLRLEGKDGTGRQHARVEQECAHCGETYTVGRVHMPREVKA